MSGDPSGRRSPSRSPELNSRRDQFQAWWPLLIGAVRDVVCLSIGAYLLLFRADNPTLTGVGVLLLTLSAAGAGKALVRALGDADSSSR